MATSAISQTEDLTALSRIVDSELRKYLGSLKASGQNPPSLRAEEPQGIVLDSATEGSKRDIIRACEKIIALVHTPFERVFIETAGYVYSTVSSVVVELKLPHLISSDPKKPTHLDELAEAAGASPELLGRLLRVLTQRLIFEEVAPGQYIHNAASKTLLIPGVEAWVGLSTEDLLQASGSLMPLLKENGYQIPHDTSKNAYAKAVKSNVNQFEHYALSDDRHGKRAALSMTAFTSTSMFNNLPYPFQDLPEGSIVVDIGGGGGHMSAHLSRQHNHLKFIVQDTGTALAYGKSRHEHHKLPIEHHEHSLFEPQRVQGAAVYLVRHVLHGFPDDTAAKVLSMIAQGGMDRNSRILIVDTVVPELYGADSVAFVNLTDIMSLLGGNGKHRTEAEWKKIVEKADGRLEVVKVWMVEENVASPDAVIEIRLKA